MLVVMVTGPAGYQPQRLVHSQIPIPASSSQLMVFYKFKHYFLAQSILDLLHPECVSNICCLVDELYAKHDCCSFSSASQETRQPAIHHN